MVTARKGASKNVDAFAQGLGLGGQLKDAFNGLGLSLRDGFNLVGHAIDNAVVGLNAVEVVLSVDRIHGGGAIDVGGHGLERI